MKRYFIMRLASALGLAFVGACASQSAPAVRLAFPYDSAKTADANYAAFRAVAFDACKSRDFLHSGEIKGEYHCRRTLLDRAVAKSGDSALAALHAAHSG